MQQYQKYFKPCAIGMCVLYLIFILALPFIVLSARGMSEDGSFSEVIDDTGWVVLPLICGIIMAIAVAVLPGKKAAIVCAAGALMALISFWLVKGYYDDKLGIVKGYASLKIGAGPILALICGIIAAVLCYMSDQSPRRDTTPGVGRGNGNEW